MVSSSPTDSSHHTSASKRRQMVCLQRQAANLAVSGHCNDGRRIPRYEVGTGNAPPQIIPVDQFSTFEIIKPAILFLTDGQHPATVAADIKRTNPVLMAWVEQLKSSGGGLEPINTSERIGQEYHLGMGNGTDSAHVSQFERDS